MPKKNRKKHQFKYAQPAPAATPVAGTSQATPVRLSNSEPSRAYVTQDLRRIGVLAAGCLILEFILWYLMNHTGLGPAIYSLVKF